MHRAVWLAAALLALGWMTSEAVASDPRHRPWPYTPKGHPAPPPISYQVPPDLFSVPRYRYGWFGAHHRPFPTRHRGFSDDLMIWGRGR